MPDRIESFDFLPGYQVLQKRFSVQICELASRLLPKRGCRDDSSSSPPAGSDKDPPPPTPTFEDFEYFQNKIVSFLKNPDEQLKQQAGDLKHQAEYQTFAQGFNRRFKPMPYFIILYFSRRSKSNIRCGNKEIYPSSHPGRWS